MVKQGKLFSLIHDADVRLSPGQKIIPSDELSTIFDASYILEKVRKDAEQYKKEVATECEELKEYNQKQGFDQGLSLWNKQLAFFEKEIKRVHEESRNVILPIAIEAAKKIVGEEMKLNKETIVHIVSTALKPALQHQQVNIYVNKNDLDILESHKPELKALFERLESLSIQEREDVQQGGCIIETEIGIINAQIEHQWRQLETVFKKVMEHEEE